MPRSERVFISVDNLLLHFGRKLDKVSGEAADPHEQIPMCLGVFAGIQQGFAADRIELFTQVIRYIHCYMTLDASTFLFELMYYSVDTDPVIATKAKALYFALSADDFDNYNDEP